MNAKETIILARKHSTNGAAMQSSAVFCLEQAVASFDAGNLDTAKRAAIRSLGYSVGIFHADHKRASAK